ncbi:MAG: hypothetical protein LBU51_01835 [Bacteroidales bacterium]|jgi:hypothetical protein|nr:hypothetical protein [Bacteroidales bacterium]
MKSIENIIKETLIRETNSSIKIDDSHFFAVIAKDEKGKYKKFILLLVAFILSIAIVATSFIFFINDVLLFQNDTQINEQGAIISNRSCNRQSVIYLFNSADKWADTGVQLQQGDKIKISVSGGFHSDIAMMKNAAENNYKPKYELVTFKKSNKNWFYNIFKCEKDTVDSTLLYNEKDAFFGSILFQIASESGVENNEIDNSKNVEAGIIQQINGQVHESEVDRNGVLYLSVNDIYLTDNVIKQLELDNIDSLKNWNIDTSKEFFTNEQIDTIRGRLPLYFVEKDTLVYYRGTKFMEYFQKNRDAYFNDNLGEILVVMNIDRKLNDFSCRSSWYRETEARIYNILDDGKEIKYEWLDNIWIGIQVIVAFFWSIICLVCKLFLIAWRLWYISIPLLLLLLYFFHKKIQEKYIKCKKYLKNKEKYEKVNDFIRSRISAVHNFLHYGK